LGFETFGIPPGKLAIRVSPAIVSDDETDTLLETDPVEVFNDPDRNEPARAVVPDASPPIERIDAAPNDSVTLNANNTQITVNNFSVLISLSFLSLFTTEMA
jgi:hypothetical protein